MEFVIGLIIAIGVIYCLCYALPLTVKDVRKIMKSEDTDYVDERD